MVASEAAPFAKTGGLADVLGALPKALQQAGEEVAVVLPFYRNAAVPNARVAYRGLQLAMGARAYSANIVEQFENGVRYLFVQIPQLYDRDGIYDERGREFPDNALRFGALCHAALGIARYLFTPDIVHCHDWQSALLPVLLNDTYRYHPAYLGLKSLLTIHNLGYQGLFPPAALADLGLPNRLFRPEFLEHWGNLNLLKGGLVFSDMLTTVSPRYAREIQTRDYGFGLDPILRARSNALVGILNGVDYSTWNPATDPHIAERFDRQHLEGKKACKRALLEEGGLPQERLEKPLIGIVSRFARQKGFDLLMQIPHALAAEDLSLVVLGSGEPHIEEFFRRFASAYPQQIAVKIGYDNALAHRIEAGADMFLMPSRYEPCGLNQIYSMRYGALPVVHATGGLDDTVDQDTGFKFADYHPQALLTCIQGAVQVYGAPRWSEMVDTAMQRNFSWEASAAQYVRLYRSLTA